MPGTTWIVVRALCISTTASDTLHHPATRTVLLNFATAGQLERLQARAILCKLCMHLLEGTPARRPGCAHLRLWRRVRRGRSRRGPLTRLILPSGAAAGAAMLRSKRSCCRPFAAAVCVKRASVVASPADMSSNAKVRHGRRLPGRCSAHKSLLSTYKAATACGISLLICVHAERGLPQEVTHGWPFPGRRSARSSSLPANAACSAALQKDAPAQRGFARDRATDSRVPCKAAAGFPAGDDSVQVRGKPLLWAWADWLARNLRNKCKLGVSCLGR